MPDTSQPASIPARSRLPLRLLALVILVGIAAFALAQRRRPFAQPRLIGTTKIFPMTIRHGEGAWYWREQTKETQASLVRIAASGSQVIAKADDLPYYAVAEGKLGWIARTGKEWAVFLSEADGSQVRTIWKDTAELMGIALIKGQIYWLKRLPAPAPDSGAFPSLSPALEVVAMPYSGEGKPNSIGRLQESDKGEILGLHENTLAIAAYRLTQPGSFCLYRMPLDKSFPVRIAGERGANRPLMTQDGVLYWLAPSEEVASPAALTLRRIAPNGQIETLSDWLPLSGELYETTKGVLYGDRERGGSLWSAGRSDQFPEPLPLPEGYNAIAAGEGLMLLAPSRATSAQYTFYEVSLP